MVLSINPQLSGQVSNDVMALSLSAGSTEVETCFTSTNLMVSPDSVCLPVARKFDCWLPRRWIRQHQIANPAPMPMTVTSAATPNKKAQAYSQNLRRWLAE